MVNLKHYHCKIKFTRRADLCRTLICVPACCALLLGTATAAPPDSVQFAVNTNDTARILQSARTQVWGDTVGTNTVSGTGNGVAQSIPVYGRVPAQGPKPSGTYQDTVTATVMF